jgi:nicotinate-nucleotide pyrophosphorylase (carboxylating)
MKGIDAQLEKLLQLSLAEDIGPRDLTSTLLPPRHTSKADAIFKEEAVLCGITIAEHIFRMIDEELRFLPVAKDGEVIAKNRAIFYVEGATRSILTAERTALNYLQHMSAVATKTRAFVEKTTGTEAKILDTRKTWPLFRALDRYSVRMGGGVNHRNGLYDGVLIKDNHIEALKKQSITDIVKSARSKFPKNVAVGVEVKNLKELAAALAAPADYILLDNFTPEQVKEAVAFRKAQKIFIPLEVSGGVNLDNVAAYAQCGVERISVGALTHSVKAVDISLNLLPVQP